MVIVKRTRSTSLKTTVERLVNGQKFGLYARGRRCYFEDGTRADLATLREALRIVHGLEALPHNNFSALCPEQYLGTFNYSYRSCQVVRKVGQLIFGAAF